MIKPIPEQNEKNKQSAVKNGIDFIALEEQVTKNNTAPLERAIKLCSLLNIE